MFSADMRTSEGYHLTFNPRHLPRHKSDLGLLPSKNSLYKVKQEATLNKHFIIPVGEKIISFELLKISTQLFFNSIVTYKSE